jgi:hypothetical protein
MPDQHQQRAEYHEPKRSAANFDLLELADESGRYGFRKRSSIPRETEYDMADA